LNGRGCNSSAAPTTTANQSKKRKWTGGGAPGAALIIMIRFDCFGNADVSVQQQPFFSLWSQKQDFHSGLYIEQTKNSPAELTFDRFQNQTILGLLPSLVQKNGGSAGMAKREPTNDYPGRYRYVRPSLAGNLDETRKPFNYLNGVCEILLSDKRRSGTCPWWCRPGRQ
jgi:hypothetical protein